MEVRVVTNMIGICYGFLRSYPIQLQFYQEASRTTPDVEMNNYGSIKNVLRSMKINHDRDTSAPIILYEQANNIKELFLLEGGGASVFAIHQNGPYAEIATCQQLTLLCSAFVLVMMGSALFVAHSWSLIRLSRLIRDWSWCCCNEQ